MNRRSRAGNRVNHAFDVGCCTSAGVGKGGDSGLGSSNEQAGARVKLSNKAYDVRLLHGCERGGRGGGLRLKDQQECCGPLVAMPRTLCPVL